MSIRSKIRGVFARARDEPQSVVPRNVTVSMESLFGDAGVRSLKASESICAAVTRLASTMGCMPVHLYRNYTVQDTHPLEKLIAFAPNANMTPYNWRYALQACLGVYGCAYGLIVPDGSGGVSSIDVLDPRRVQIMRNRDTGEIWYEVGLDDGSHVYVHTSGMIALKWGSTDGVNSVSPIEVLGATLKYDRAIKDVSIQQLEGLNGAVALSFPTAVGDKMKSVLIDRFVSTYKKSRGQVLILEGGVTADKIQGSVVDPNVLNADSITKSKIAAVYGMPLRMVGAQADCDYSTSEQVMREFMALTMLPYVQAWEDELNRKLLMWGLYSQGYRFHFSMDALLRSDSATTAERHSKAIRSGKLTPNEARAEDYLPPLENGDELLSARDLIPLRIAVDQPELLLGIRGGENDG